MIKCSNCGFEFDEGVFCPMCGTKNDSPTTELQLSDDQDLSRVSADNAQLPSDSNQPDINQSVESSIADETNESLKPEFNTPIIETPQPKNTELSINPQHSSLSIIALILSVIPITFFAGFIVSIVDLSKTQQIGKKHLLSYIALGIASIWIVLACILLFSDSPSGSDDTSSTANTQEVSSEESTVNGSSSKNDQVAKDKTKISENSSGVADRKDNIDEPKNDNIEEEIEETFVLRNYDESNMPERRQMEKNGEFLSYSDAMKSTLAPGRFVSCDVKIGSKVEISSYTCYYAVTGEMQGDGESETEFLSLGNFDDQYFILIDERLEKTHFIKGSYVHIYGVYSGVKRFKFENQVVGGPKVYERMVPVITVCYSDDQPEQAEGEAIVVVSASDGGVNLRTGPGTEYDVIESMIPTGEVLSKIGQTSSNSGKTWLNVIRNGKEGWVAESQVTDGAEYILPYSSVRELTESDLQSLSAQDLTYARNELYAKHGYLFNATELWRYFNSRTWYHPDDTFDGKLHGVEERNASFISDYQKQHGLTYKPE